MCDGVCWKRKEGMVELMTERKSKKLNAKSIDNENVTLGEKRKERKWQSRKNFLDEKILEICPFFVATQIQD